VCQLEGSDHGGRDSAAELALAGTIDVQASDSSFNRLTLGPASSDAGNYTPPKRTVNGFVRNHVCWRLSEGNAAMGWCAFNRNGVTWSHCIRSKEIVPLFHTRPGTLTPGPSEILCE